MDWYKADLHVHSVLSPCGDLEMSPVRIIEEAKKQQIDILAITDHNSTKHCKLMMKFGEKEGICVIPGVEFNSMEEIHCVGLFESLEQVDEIQGFIEENAPDIQNDPQRFGYQVVVNEQEEITEEIDYLLIAALTKGINDIEEKVHQVGGLFIAAHIDRPYYSIKSQLGFIPSDIKLDAIEISYAYSADQAIKEFSNLNRTIVRNSDAHMPNQLGRAYTKYQMEKPSFSGLKQILENNLTNRIAF